MNPRRTTRGQLFDTVEEGGLRASAPYVSSTEIAEQENERGLDTLHDRVNVLKRVYLLHTCCLLQLGVHAALQPEEFSLHVM
jgi:hypothetical protein